MSRTRTRRLSPLVAVFTFLILSSSSSPTRAQEVGDPPPPQVPSRTGPQLLERVDPTYPEAARQAGIGGTVQLQLEVGADGAVKEVKVLKAAGFGLDDAAATAAKKFRFKPATDHGAPAACTVLFDQSFNVNTHMSAAMTVSAPPPPEPPPPAPVASGPVPLDDAIASRYRSTVEGRGPTSAASAQTLRDLDLELRPLTAPNDILRVVPGLLTVQHQGGGKADQLFLRGFDADHGTDVGVFVDGVPVNMPSHAHGQGFADLHWMIPEALDSIEVVKHPYDARYGDFSTAGAVNLVTRKDFAESYALITGGGFPTLGCSGGVENCKAFAQQRALLVVAPKFTGWASKIHAWIAGEMARDQGPFVAPEGLLRYNLFAKLTYDISPRTEIGFFFQAYGSQWTGSGQIPERDVASGRISQFGSEDPSEGGLTERQMLTVFVKHHDEDQELLFTAYVTRYRLALFNDFTFFLTDPINGDEFEQDDSRTFAGAIFQLRRVNQWHGIRFRTLLGASARYDGVHIDLWNAESDSVNDAGQSSGGTDFRQRLGRRVDASSEAMNMLGPGGAINVLNLGANDDIDELNLAIFGEEDIAWTRWLRTVIGMRVDYFGFNVSDADQSYPTTAALSNGVNTSGSKQIATPSPKASIVFTPAAPLDIYLNFGMGFHSNDARISILQGTLKTPDGTPVQVLPHFYAGEIGARYTFQKYFTAAAAFWASYLENEMTIDSDTGTFAPGDPTERYGLDLELRAHPVKWLYIDYDLAWAHSTSVPDQGNGGELALAPKLYMTGGISYIGTGVMSGLRARFGMRYLSGNPVFDTNSPEYIALNATHPEQVNGEGYLIFDLSGSYRVRWFEVGFSIQNLFNSTWREAQFGNESCTYDEVNNASNPNYNVCGKTIAAAQRTGVPDVHFTPGVPFNLQVSLKAYF